jgi:hypothetical protein
MYKQILGSCSVSTATYSPFLFSVTTIRCLTSCLQKLLSACLYEAWHEKPKPCCTSAVSAYGVGHDLDLTSLNHGHLDYKGRSPIIFGFLPLVATGDAVLPICLNKKLSSDAKWTNRQWNVYRYRLRVVLKMWLVKSSDMVEQRSGN